MLQIDCTQLDHVLSGSSIELIESIVTTSARDRSLLVFRQRPTGSDRGEGDNARYSERVKLKEIEY